VFKSAMKQKCRWPATQSCKRALFWSLNPARTRNHTSEPDIYV